MTPLRLAHFTPGTGHFYCGSCLRDNALVRALGRRGHDVTMVPLYLPFALEEGEAPPTDRVFLGGVNMYLQQKLPILGRLPDPIARRLDSPRLLRWLSSKRDMTDASGLGPMVVSTLKGPSGRQAREVDKLISWMQERPAPDVLCLSNVMLTGLARRLKTALGAPVICSLQGEAPFLDALAEPYRSRAWAILAEHADDIDAFVPVSDYYGAVMAEKLGLDPGRMHVVHNGIELDGFTEAAPARDAGHPTIGYLARMCPDKGLHTLVDAFVNLKQRGDIEGLRLHAAGVVLAGDRRYVADLEQRLDREGLAGDVRFQPNVDRAEKLAFLQTLSVLSVPATYGESFGLYVLEALAAGVPVVQPRHGAFPEVLAATGGGLLCEPDDPESLADALGRLLTDPGTARSLAERGRAHVFAHCSDDHMAQAFEAVTMMVVPCPTTSR